MTTTAAIALRRLTAAHKARTREWANDPELARLMDRARLVGEDEHEAWFTSILARTDCAYFAIETAADQRHIGNVWLWNIDSRHRKAELRIVIGEPSARGHGLGSTAIDLACRTAFTELKLHRVYAYVLAINPAARRAFEQAGFMLEGVLRGDRWSSDRFVDAFLLARIAS